MVDDQEWDSASEQERQRWLSQISRHNRDYYRSAYRFRYDDLPAELQYELAGVVRSAMGSIYSALVPKKVEKILFYIFGGLTAVSMVGIAVQLILP